MTAPDLPPIYCTGHGRTGWLPIGKVIGPDRLWTRRGNRRVGACNCIARLWCLTKAWLIALTSAPVVPVASRGASD